MEIRTSDARIRTPDGEMPAHLVEPAAAGSFPAVVVLMEAFGLVPHIREVTERIAREGYVALAPDLYYRVPDNTARYDELPRAIGLMQKVDDAKFTADLRAALAFLCARASVNGARIGVTGFCMGGRLAFLAACALPGEIAAAAPFYGGGIATLLPRADAIRCPLHLFFGEADPFIPVSQVREIESKLQALGKRFALDCYPGADHGFFCNERPSYSEKAARDAWQKLTRFFATHLKG